jgi:hypothetical protein
MTAAFLALAAAAFYGAAYFWYFNGDPRPGAGSARCGGASVRRRKRGGRRSTTSLPAAS